MSADIWLNAAGCCYSHDHNITHNLGAMFRELGLDWHDFYSHDGNGGRTAAEMLPLAVIAHHRLRSDGEDYRHLEAPNGWGTVPQAVDFLRRLMYDLALHPDAIVEVSL